MKEKKKNMSHINNINTYKKHCIRTTLQQKDDVRGEEKVISFFEFI